MTTVLVEEVRNTVEVDDGTTVVVVVEERVQVVDAAVQGPQGAPGASSSSYVHTQTPAAASWVVNHDLGYRPAVTVFDGTGALVVTDFVHNSTSSLTITFGAPLAGVAYLS